MKWPKGPAGVLLGIGAALLVAVALWFGVRALSAERPPGDVPPGLPGGSTAPTSAPGDPSTLPGTRTPAATASPGGATGGGGTSSGGGSGSGPGGTPSAPDKTAFTESQARETIATFLGHIGEGRPAEARAMATPEFAASTGPEFFKRVSDPISVAEVLLATREGGHWTVYCGELWATGPRQTRYGLAETGGKLLVDSFELADLP